MRLNELLGYKKTIADLKDSNTSLLNIMKKQDMNIWAVDHLDMFSSIIADI